MVPVLHLPCLLSQGCLGRAVPAETGDGASRPGSKRLHAPTSQATQWQWQQVMEEEKEGRQRLSSPNLPRRGSALGVSERFDVSIHVASFNGLLCLRGCGWKYSRSSHLAGPASKKQVTFALLGFYIEQLFRFSSEQVSKQSGTPGTTCFNQHFTYLWSQHYMQRPRVAKEPPSSPTPAAQSTAGQGATGLHRDVPTLACFISRMILEPHTVAQLQLGVGHLAPLAPAVAPLAPAVGSSKQAEDGSIYVKVVKNPPMHPCLVYCGAPVVRCSSAQSTPLRCNRRQAKWHCVEQCLERPGLRVNPSHPLQQDKLLVFSSPPLGTERELFCPSPQRGKEASGIFQQLIAFIVQASV